MRYLLFVVLLVNSFPAIANEVVRPCVVAPGLPQFPPIGRAAKAQTTPPIELDITLDENGAALQFNVTNAKQEGRGPNDPHPIYVAAAVDALRDWRFPAVIATGSREVHLRITYHLNDPNAAEMMKGCTTSRIVINFPNIDIWAAPLNRYELDSYQPSVGSKK
jgi:hypothetical protein